MRRRAFSLIELVVVLVLMAVMASVATISIRGAVVRQRLSRAAEVVEQFDTALRRQARYQRRKVVGVIDRSQGRMTVDPGNDRPISFELPNHTSIDSIRFGRSRPSRSDSRVLADSDGSSTSYAVRLSVGETKRWVLLIGGTGQVIHDLTDRSVASLLGAR